MTPGTAAPAAPPGWEAATRNLVRLVDRSGAALAWLAPRYGANLVGYAVRRPAGWQQVLYAAGPQALAARPTRYGCPVLCPFPGFVTGARYTWHGHNYTLPPNLPGGRGYAHGFAHTHSWRMTQASVDTATAELATMTDLPSAARAGYPFALRLRLTARLVGQALVLELERVTAPRRSGSDSIPTSIRWCSAGRASSCARACQGRQNGCWIARCRPAQPGLPRLALCRCRQRARQH